jgi:hypothetical protein
MESKFPNIFLSHRSGDKEIADTIKKHLEYWGLPEKSIFHASAPGSGVSPGEYLNQQLSQALVNSNLVILVYTFADLDWSYCMWECGLATNPLESGTRTIVFQCVSEEAPKPFSGQLLVKITPDEILDFTTKFHKDDGFCPGREACFPNVSEKAIKQRATDFYKELSKKVPSGRSEERPRWDYFTIKMPKEVVGTVKHHPGMDEEISELIKKESKVKDHFGNALKHFNYYSWERDLTLKKLITRWLNETEVQEEAGEEWITVLCAEICRAIRNIPAQPIWKKMKSLFSSWSYYVILNHARSAPDESMEFDVYMYRFEEN